MKALQMGDYERAFSLCTPALQRRLGSHTRLQQVVESAASRPDAWHFSQPSLEGTNTYMSGTMLAGREGTFTIRLSQIQGQWRIDDFEFLFR